jgi:hypothetical protein
MVITIKIKVVRATMPMAEVFITCFILKVQSIVKSLRAIKSILTPIILMGMKKPTTKSRLF